MDISSLTLNTTIAKAFHSSTKGIRSEKGNKKKEGGREACEMGEGRRERYSFIVLVSIINKSFVCI